MVWALRILLPLLLLGAVTGYAGLKGYQKGTGDANAIWIERWNKQREAMERLIAARAELRARLESEARARDAELGAARARTREELRKAAASVASCRVSLDALRVLDAASRVPPVPEAPGKPDAGAEAAGASCADVLQTAGENYEICSANAADQEELIKWIKTVTTPSDSAAKK